MINSKNIIEQVEGVAPLLQVFDMPASLWFYRDQIGFEVSMSSGEGDDVDWVLMVLNGSTIMLNTAFEKHERPTTFEALRSEGHADVTLYFGCPDIDALYAYFCEKGLQVAPPQLTGYGWKAITLTDPDRYRLCFHYPIDRQ